MARAGMKRVALAATSDGSRTGTSRRGIRVRLDGPAQERRAAESYGLGANKVRMGDLENEIGARGCLVAAAMTGNAEEAA